MRLATTQRCTSSSPRPWTPRPPAPPGELAHLLSQPLPILPVSSRSPQALQSPVGPPQFCYALRRSRKPPTFSSIHPLPLRCLIKPPNPVPHPPVPSRFSPTSQSPTPFSHSPHCTPHASQSPFRAPPAPFAVPQASSVPHHRPRFPSRPSWSTPCPPSIPSSPPRSSRDRRVSPQSLHPSIASPCPIAPLSSPSLPFLTILVPPGHSGCRCCLPSPPSPISSPLVFLRHSRHSPVLSQCLVISSPPVLSHTPGAPWCSLDPLVASPVIPRALSSPQDFLVPTRVPRSSHSPRSQPWSCPLPLEGPAVLPLLSLCPWSSR